MIDVDEFDFFKLPALDITLYQIDHWVTTLLVSKALKRKDVLFQKSSNGFLINGKQSIAELIDQLKLNALCKAEGREIYHNPNSIVSVEGGVIDGDSNVATLRLLTTDESVYKQFVEIMGKSIAKTKQNEIFVLSNSMGDIYLAPIGTLSSPIVRENYSDTVIQGFDFLSKDFVSTNPFGRLAIINGPPGTGKTYLVRGLVNELADSTVVVMPPRMIADIDGPSLVSTFANHQRRNPGPMVLIIEDADSCLAPRVSGDVSSISALLNHTDGILGSMLNLRIIATTNQESMEFDSALTRAGRLSRHIEVGELSNTKATEIYRRLTGSDSFKYDGKKTLAEIYADAKIDSDGNIAEFEDDPNFDPNPGRNLKMSVKKVGFW